MTARAEVALALRALAAEGFFPLPFGHLSVRQPAEDGDTVLILRHLHDDPLPIGAIQTEDVVPIDLNGDPLEGIDAPGERFAHTAVYRARPDVSCVLHYHSRATAAVGLARDVLVPQTPLGVILGATVPVHSDGGQVDTRGKGDDLAATLGTGAAVLLPGHGAVVLGASVEEAVARAIALEDCCSLELAAAALGARPAPPRATGPASHATEVYSTLWRGLLQKHGLERDADVLAS